MLVAEIGKGQPFVQSAAFKIIQACNVQMSRVIAPPGDSNLHAGMECKLKALAPGDGG